MTQIDSSCHARTVHCTVVGGTLGDGRVELRGRVQHVLSGERRHFRDWPTLVRYLERKLQELDVEEAPWRSACGERIQLASEKTTCQDCRRAQNRGNRRL